MIKLLLNFFTRLFYNEDKNLIRKFCLTKSSPKNLIHSRQKFIKMDFENSLK